MVCAEQGSREGLAGLALLRVGLGLAGVSSPVAGPGPSGGSACSVLEELQLIAPYQTPSRNLQCLICLLPWQRSCLRSASPGCLLCSLLHISEQPGWLSHGTPCPPPGPTAGTGLPGEQSPCRAPVPHRDTGSHCPPVSCSFPFAGLADEGSQAVSVASRPLRAGPGAIVPIAAPACLLDSQGLQGG